MKNSLFTFVIVCLLVSVVSAQEQKPVDDWKLHGFVEQQYRPTQDFSSTSLWLTAKKEISNVGIFNFSQIVNPSAPTKVNYWQSYAGAYIGKATGLGFLEGGVAAGAEAGGHLRLAAYAFVASKRGGVSLFVIHEQGLYRGSGWTRLHAMKSVTKGLKVGYHHQTYLGDGINADLKIGKTPLSIFAVVARDYGQTKSMIAVRYNF